MPTLSNLLSLPPASADSAILSSLSLASADAADADFVHFVFGFSLTLSSADSADVDSVYSLTS